MTTAATLSPIHAREPQPEREPTRIVTVRMPKSLHEQLKAEAHERRTSMNQLCINKLLRPEPAAAGGESAA